MVSWWTTETTINRCRQQTLRWSEGGTADQDVSRYPTETSTQTGGSKHWDGQRMGLQGSMQLLKIWTANMYRREKEGADQHNKLQEQWSTIMLMRYF